METIDDLNKRMAKMESDSAAFRLERTNLVEEIKSYENKVFTLEEKLIEEVSAVKENSDQASSQRIGHLEAELELKCKQAQTLQEQLTELQAKHDQHQVQVNSYADQLRDLRRTSEEEQRRRKASDDKLAQITVNNVELQAKVDELMHASGSSSDMMVKLNDELQSKQREWQAREKQLLDEMELLHKHKDDKDNELRTVKVGFTRLHWTVII